MISQHWGMGTPQVLATFLALGDVTQDLKLGFLMYPHRHGFCSFSFAQHCAVGVADDVNAGKHGDSSVTEHVAAVAIWDPVKLNTRITTAITVVHAAVLISKYLEKSAKKEGWVWRI